MAIYLHIPISFDFIYSMKNYQLKIQINVRTSVVGHAMTTLIATHFNMMAQLASMVVTYHLYIMSRQQTISQQ